MTGKNKKKLDYDQKVCEALEIKKENCGPRKGINEDRGSYVKTAYIADGAGGPALLGLSVFDHSLFFYDLSLQSPIVSLSPLNSSLSLFLSFCL